MWPNYGLAAVDARRRAWLFLRRPLLAWVYGIGFANFCQSLSPEQKPQNPTGGGNGPPPPTDDQNGVKMVMRGLRKASATWK